MIRFLTRSTTSVFVLLALLGQSFAQAPPIIGFAPQYVAGQRAAEAKFDSFLRADNLRDRQKRLSARPHHLGSAYDKDNAEFIAEQFRSWGYDTKIESFDVLFP